MKFKFLSTTASKKKVGTLIVCGALVVTAIGVVSASAANSITSLQVKFENGVKHYSTDDGKSWQKQAPAGVNEETDADGQVTISNGIPPMDGESGGSLTKVEDGQTSISTDGGQTWSDEAHQGKTEGVEAVRTDGASDEVSVMIKIEDGVKLFSLDGGKTWSKQAPQGFIEEDGKATQSNGTPPREGESGGMLTKVEDGAISYSTDGGKTWNKR